MKATPVALLRDSDAMDLLGGMRVESFMRKHWQRKPLCVRQALPSASDLIDAATLKALSKNADVESRLITRPRAVNDRWTVKHGPLTRRNWPAMRTPGWTVLVQGVDLHNERAHALLKRFAFASWVRLDDVMVSIASQGGGVGAHVDAYDVFLLQVAGRREWRVGPVAQPDWLPDTPLKQLKGFKPDTVMTLEPGDMLYLPPGWGHDGIALDGPCITASVGFRAPHAHELASDLLGRIADGMDERIDGGMVQASNGARVESFDMQVRYRDPRAIKRATLGAARIPDAIHRYAHDALQAVLRESNTLSLALGESLTEPKSMVCFDPSHDVRAGVHHGLVRLDRRTRMLYDDRHVFINGEGFAVSGLDASVLRRLADERQLDAQHVKRLSKPARQTMIEWMRAGWLHACETP